jgi:hypothetical protein
LTITPATGPPLAGIVGIHTSSNGAGLELLPAAATNDGSVLVANITHFSVVGIAVPAAPGDLLSFPGSSFHDAVVAADDQPAIQRSVLERWFDQLIWSLLRTGQTDTTSLLKGMREFLDWQGQRIIYSVAQTPLSSPAIQIQAAEGRRLIADGLRAAVARHNSLCVSERSLARAEEVMRLQALAESTAAVLIGEGFVQAGFVTSLQPSLDLTGLTLTSVVQNLCVDVSIVSTSFPGSGDLTPGVPAPLTVRAGMTFTGGGAPLFSPPLQVVVDAVGATPAQRVGFTNSTGNFQTTFTPQITGMGLSVLAAFVDATHPYLTNAALIDTTLVGRAVIVTPSQTTITLGASHQFSAVVQGTSNQAVTWSVTGGGSITQTGLFTSAGVAGTFFVKATSVADPSMVGVAQITVGAGSCTNVFVSSSGVGVPRGGTRQFLATSSPGGPSVDVTWSIVGSGGTIAADGLFTAGAVATADFQVKATCITDLSVSGTANVHVLALRVGRYESIPDTALVQFLGASGACPIAADHQPASWTVDVTSLPTGVQPYMVTVTNTVPSGVAVRYDANGKGLDDPTHRLEMTAVMGGLSIKYYKLATDTNSAPLVAIHPQGFCPGDGLSYTAKLWEVSFID